MFKLIKSFFNKKKQEINKFAKKEFSDEELAVLKIQYNKINEFASKEAEQSTEKNKQYYFDRNNKCPNCKSENINDRIKRFEGKIDGQSSGYGWNALSFGESYSYGSIKGKFDTNEVNKCNDCQNEWKKVDITIYVSPSHIIETRLSYIKYYFGALKSANEATWDRNDLKEKNKNKHGK